jgi:hypothetical protein
MVMASKVWDDLSMWNADFSQVRACVIEGFWMYMCEFKHTLKPLHVCVWVYVQVCPSFTLKRINELELAVLDTLRYSIKVRTPRCTHQFESYARSGLKNVCICMYLRRYQLANMPSTTFTCGL